MIALLCVCGGCVGVCVCVFVVVRCGVYLVISLHFANHYVASYTTKMIIIRLLICECFFRYNNSTATTTSITPHIYHTHTPLHTHTHTHTHTQLSHTPHTHTHTHTGTAITPCTPHTHCTIAVYRVCACEGS